MRVELKVPHKPDPFEDMPADAQHLMTIVLKDFAQGIMGDADLWVDFLSLVQQGAIILSIDTDDGIVTMRSNIVGRDFEYRLTPNMVN